MGIDPGLQGSIVSIAERVVSVWPMPLREGKRAGIRVDVGRVAYIIHSSPPNLEHTGPALITMEQAQSYPGQGVTSSFSYGANYGALLAILTLSGCPFRVASPQSWKRLFSLQGKPKEEAVVVACRLIPELRTLLYDGEGKPHHSRVARISMSEAALLALSGAELSRTG